MHRKVQIFGTQMGCGSNFHKKYFFFCIDYSKVKASRIEGNLLKNSQKSLKEGLIEKRLICQLALHTQKDFL